MSALYRDLPDQLAVQDTRHEDADIIVLSLAGLAFGHFEIRDKVAPDDRDRHDFSPVKCAYIGGGRARYLQPARLMLLGIKVETAGYTCIPRAIRGD
jgi:hypothetical protein